MSFKKHLEVVNILLRGYNMNAIDTRDLYKTHFQNKMLIESYDIHIGNKYKLKPEFAVKYNTRHVTIESINMEYGWIKCKETRRIPHKVILLLKCFELDSEFVELNTMYRVVFSGKDVQNNTAGEIFGAFGERAKLNPLTKHIQYNGTRYNFIAYPESVEDEQI